MFITCIFLQSQILFYWMSKSKQWALWSLLAQWALWAMLLYFLTHLPCFELVTVSWLKGSAHGRSQFDCGLFHKVKSKVISEESFWWITWREGWQGLHASGLTHNFLDERNSSSNHHWIELEGTTCNIMDFMRFSLGICRRVGRA